MQYQQWRGTRLALGHSKPKRMKSRIQRLFLKDVSVVASTVDGSQGGMRPRPCSFVLQNLYAKGWEIASREGLLVFGDRQGLQLAQETRGERNVNSLGDTWGQVIVWTINPVGV
jgi:hypothetical protein